MSIHRRRRGAPFPALLVLLTLLARPLGAQTTSTVLGTVVGPDGAPLAGAIVRLAGTDVSSASSAEGAFVLRGLPVGEATLSVSHPSHGAHERPIRVARAGETFTMTIRLSPEGMEVELLGARPATDDLVESVPLSALEGLTPPPTGPEPTPRAGAVLERPRVLELSGSSRDLGDLIRRGIPTLQERRSDDLALAGVGLCLEFRGASVRSMRAGNADVTCNHPTVYLDGVLMQDPQATYGMTALGSIEWVQAIPPGEAGAQFGAAPYGVILVVTTGGNRPGLARPMTARRSRTFDWSQDPEGHSFFKTLLGAAAGNAAGLAAGLAIGRECIYIDHTVDEVERSCGRPAVAGTGLAAVLLPAFGSALGARLGGRTDNSVGRTIPALVGAGMTIVPGYAFSLSTVGDGVQTMNTVGTVLLVAGTPIIVTIADRLYRTLRDR